MGDAPMFSFPNVAVNNPNISRKQLVIDNKYSAMRILLISVYACKLLHVLGDTGWRHCAALWRLLLHVILLQQQGHCRNKLGHSLSLSFPESWSLSHFVM